MQDVKPTNVLIAQDGTVKLADFGMSTTYNPEGPLVYPSVVSLWYRPPELLLNAANIDCSVDVWSLGCLFAELMLGVPLFKGCSDLDQIRKIVDVLGSPSTLNWPVRSRLCPLLLGCSLCDLRGHSPRRTLSLCLS